MRIVAGKFKGKRIIAPKKLPVRPTTDFGKEALFNILNNRYDFCEIRVLDLFAGTGNISYEFASRGTEDIVSVDTHYGCVRFIQRTAEELEIEIKTVKSDVFKYLDVSQLPYDIIFADPPYNFELSELETLITKCFENDLLKEGGSLIIEHSKHINLEEQAHFSEFRKYGGSVFSFFQ
ncbi:MAG: methyltransferase domain-containing protein [Flavobacterium sp.]|nr:MAG: methyltransferase domain-containing protein [Flavobacterium sp.]